jgi:hypothetical protein
MVLVVFLSTPALQQFTFRFKRRKDQYEQITSQYEDADGTATEESLKAYTDFIPRLLLILVSAIATSVALASAILITTRPDSPLTIEHWLQFTSWVRHSGKNGHQFVS